MKNEIKITDLIFLASQTDNLFMLERLTELKELIETTPNNFKLGSEIRKLL